MYNDPTTKYNHLLVFFPFFRAEMWIRVTPCHVCPF